MSTLIFDRQNNIGILKINRPQALNALNFQVLKDLQDFLNSDLTGLRALVVTGEGEKSFVAGADIKEMETLTKDDAWKMADRGQAVFTKLSEAPFVSIAAVNGFALGGGLELALSCDIILASSKAKLGLPEVSLGLIPGYGGTQRLARTVGLQFARYMVLSGEMVTASEAQAVGLVAKTFEPEKLQEEAMDLAKKIAARGPLAVNMAKKAIRRGFHTDLHEGLKIEAEYFAQTFATKDHNEGIKAFIEKRAPQFNGE